MNPRLVNEKLREIESEKEELADAVTKLRKDNRTYIIIVGGEKTHIS